MKTWGNALESYRVDTTRKVNEVFAIATCAHKGVFAEIRHRFSRHTRSGDPAFRRILPLTPKFGARRTRWDPTDLSSSVIANKRKQRR